MEKFHIAIDFECCTTDGLSPERQKIAEAARQACKKSYSPYSGFAVGAALELENGEILAANNQENAAYPSGLCAERTLLFYAKAKEPDAVIVRMAVAAKNGNAFTDVPIPPCGACRQVMIEVARRQKTPIELIMVGNKKCIIADDVKKLLPLQFEAENMK